MTRRTQQISYDRFFQPVVLLRVNGEDADDLVMRMGNFEVHEDEKRATKVKVTFEMFDPVDSSPTDRYNFTEESLIEDTRLWPGATWEIRWGYFSDMSDVLGVRVTHFKPNFKADGTAIVQVFLHDRQVRLNRDTRSTNYGRVQTSDIAARIAQRYGLDLNSEDSNDVRRRDYIQPANVGDITFLQTLAQRIGFVCFVEGNVLHYHRPDFESPPLLHLYWYGAEEGGQGAQVLQTFEPEVKENRRRRTRAAGGDAEEDGAEDSEDGGGSNQGDTISFDFANLRVNRERTMPATTEETPEEDRQLRRRAAEAQQRRFLRGVNKANISCLGSPQLRRDKNICVLGVGVQLSGTWHIRESTHTLNSGGQYMTKCKIRRGAHNARNPNQENQDQDNQDQGNQDQEAAEESGSADGIVFDFAGLQVVNRPSQSRGDPTGSTDVPRTGVPIPPE